MEVIIVDNGSTDEGLRWTSSSPQLTIIRNKQNLGFPSAVNQAARVARGNFLAILNQDTEVDGNWLQELISVFHSNPRVGICGPKILDLPNKNKIQQLGVLVDRFGFGIYNTLETNSLQEVFMVSGAAMVIRREVFDLAGGLDEEYFMLEEDLDFCWRVRLLGYHIIVNPKALVYHYGGASLSGGFPNHARFVTSHARRYYTERNTLQTLLKNYQLQNIFKILPLYLGLNVVEMGLFLIMGEIGAPLDYAKSILYNLSHFRRVWRKHLAVARHRRVDDSHIRALQQEQKLKVLAFLKWGVPTFEGQNPLA